MKFFKLATVAFILMVIGTGALMMGCDVTEESKDQEPKVIHESDGNDSRESSDYLHPGNIGKGTAGDADGVDWWTTSTVEGYSYKFTATAESSLAITLKAWNKANTELDTLDSLSGTSINKTIDGNNTYDDYYWVISASQETDYELLYEGQ